MENERKLWNMSSQGLWDEWLNHDHYSNIYLFYQDIEDKVYPNLYEFLFNTETYEQENINNELFTLAWVGHVTILVQGKETTFK